MIPSSICTLPPPSLRALPDTAALNVRSSPRTAHPFVKKKYVRICVRMGRRDVMRTCNRLARADAKRMCGWACTRAHRTRHRPRHAGAPPRQTAAQTMHTMRASIHAGVSISLVMLAHMHAHLYKPARMSIDTHVHIHINPHADGAVTALSARGRVTQANASADINV